MYGADMAIFFLKLCLKSGKVVCVIRNVLEITSVERM